MIGNRLEQDIIKVFADNIGGTFSINSLSKALGKAYPYINRKANFFLAQGILRKIDLGNSYQCFLNLKSEKTKIYLMMNELNKRDIYAQRNRLPRIYDDRLTIVYAGEMYIVSDEPVKNSRHKVISGRKLIEMLIAGPKDIVVVNNIERYVSILSELGDEILLKGLTRKE